MCVGLLCTVAVADRQKRQVALWEEKAARCHFHSGQPFRCLLARHAQTHSSPLGSQPATHKSTDPQLSKQEAPTSLNHLLTLRLHQVLLMAVLHPTKPID